MKYLITILLSVISQYVISQNNSVISFLETKPPYMSISPTISKLEQLNNDSLTRAITKLWENVKKNGSPLIEKDTLYDDYSYITFIYQQSTPIKEVCLFIPGIYDEYKFGDMKMYRLKNTDLYYRCYMLPNDVCLSYRFDVKYTTQKNTVKELDKYNTNAIPKGRKKDYSYSVLDLSTYDNIDWNEKRYNNNGSKIDTFKFYSTLLNNSRDIYVYLPPGYDSKKTIGYPVIYLFDSFVYLNRVEVPTVLDNLISEKKIEPVIAVMLDNPAYEQRYIEYPLNFKFKEAMISEFVPLIRNKFNTSLKPENNIIGGMSYGGLAAGFIAFYHSDIFGKVLSQSGSFWRDIKLKDNSDNEIRNDWLIRQFEKEDKHQLKIFLDWGLQENMVLGSNRTFVKILDKKGYPFKFIEFNGWHNWANTRRTFPLGLMYLMEQ